MNYKESLLFTAKCLTINTDEHNLLIVTRKLTNFPNEINWDNIVKISSKHYVLPALYCNLKQAELLHLIPSELNDYIQEITFLNRERNKQIIQQAKEINQLLLSNNITPIFIKGTGNLLERLYNDIGERMVGDIDFIVSKKEFYKSVHLLKQENYEKTINRLFYSPITKHYPRLKNKNKLAAVEVHCEFTINQYKKEFNYEFIKNEIQTVDNISILSDKHQLCLSIIAAQINDNGIYFKNIPLRNAYDVLLLSKKVNSLHSIKQFKKLFHPLNNFLALAKFIFRSSSITFKKTGKSKKSVTKYKNLIEKSSEYLAKRNKRVNREIRYNHWFKLIKKALSEKEYTIWLLKRIWFGKPKDI